MEWLFRQMGKNEIERDVTQRSQFDTDDAKIEATLIRESHQNSLDARPKNSDCPVKTKITVFMPTGNEDYFEALFKGLPPHLLASGVDLDEIDFRRPTFLLIEDFGTTGLIGKWNDWDDQPFTDFWRREGRSNKSGTSNGRWGLGKLVFSSASRIRTFFGLTIRTDDPGQMLLMGEAVLTTRTIGTAKFDPYAYYGDAGADSLQIPETDPASIDKFRVACGITRINEPGFSVVIPYPIQQLEPASLIEGVLRHYFFPILTGQLEVDIQGELINAATFEAVAAKCGKSVLSAELIEFIRKIDDCQNKCPDIELSEGWPSNVEAAIDPSKLEALRRSFAKEGKVIHARAPITLRRKDGDVRKTHFDLFLRKAGDGVQGESLYIRSTITIPNESRYFNPSDTFGALHAKDDDIASFLGDAENPAHTQWNASAERLKEHWKNGSARLSEVRSSLRALYKVLAQVEEQREPDALIDFFSIKDLQSSKKPVPKKVAVKPPIPNLPTAPKAYRIAAKRGGFAIKPAGGLSQEALPVLLKVRVAYDLLSGNPMKRFDPLDFRLDTPPIQIDHKGVAWTSPAPNSLEVQINDLDFSVEVSGFDPNRDLLVDARKESR